MARLLIYWKLWMKNGDWNKVERSVFKHGLLMEQVWYLKRYNAENSITLNFSEVLKATRRKLLMARHLNCIERYARRMVIGMKLQKLKWTECQVFSHCCPYGKCGTNLSDVTAFWAVNSKMTKRNRADMRGLLTSTKEPNPLWNRHKLRDIYERFVFLNTNDYTTFLKILSSNSQHDQVEQS